MLVRRHWRVEASLPAMASQIPKQRWDKGERCMYIFCGKCPRTQEHVGKMWNLGQRQNTVPITGKCWLPENRRQEGRTQEGTQDKEDVR